MLIIQKSCAIAQNGYVKRIKNLGFDLKRTVVIDDLPLSYRENSENAIPIKSWGNRRLDDRELWQVLQKIEKIRNHKDVRKSLAKLNEY